jgi:cytochrome c553
MKLSTKLIAAPVLTAAAMLGVAQVQSGLAGRASTGLQTPAARHFDQSKHLAQTQTRLQALDQSLLALAQADPSLGPRVAEAGQHLKAYGDKADAAIDLATVDAKPGSAALQGADEGFSQLAGSMGQLISQLETGSRAEASAAMDQAAQAHWLLSGLALLVAGVAVFVGWRIQRHVVKDLARAGSAADVIAAGRLGKPIDADRSDQVGAVLRSLEHRRAALQQSLRTGHESTQFIGVASAEIATGNADLSVRSLAQRSAEAARQIKGLIVSSVERVQAGRKLVGEAGTTMTKIMASVQRVSAIIGEISAAESLRAQAQRLGNVVAAFQLEPSSTAAGVLPVPAAARRPMHIVVIPLLMLTLACAAQAAPPPLQVQVWAASCMACHGTDGRATGTGMVIAGQPVAALLKSLRDFRDGRRPATVMHQHAKGYSDAELALLAAHFASLSPR